MSNYCHTLSLYFPYLWLIVVWEATLPVNKVVPAIIDAKGPVTLEHSIIGTKIPSLLTPKETADGLTQSNPYV